MSEVFKFLAPSHLCQEQSGIDRLRFSIYKENIKRIINLFAMARFNQALAIFGLATAVVASPLAAVAETTTAAPVVAQTQYPAVESRLKLHLGTAIGGALDLPTTVKGSSKIPQATAKAMVQAEAWAGQATITVVNSHGDDISTVHVNGAGPQATGNVAPGRLANGQSDTFTVSPGWNGNVAINDAQWYVA